MICPNCSSINKDDAKICKECGIRLAGRPVRPESKEQEKKYLITGAIALAGLILFIAIMIGGFSCICGSCRPNAGETDINSNVGGDYDVIGSGSDVTSNGDNQGLGDDQDPSVE